MQKKHIAYAQAKGAPAGFVLPYLVMKEAIARHFVEDLPSDVARNITLNAESSLVRVSAIGGGVFVAFKEDVTKDGTVQATVVLSLDDNPTHLDNFILGDQEYIYKNALQAKAQATLTFIGVVADGQLVTLGEDVYEFDTDSSVTEGHIAVDVSGGVTASDAVTALVSAITASGTEPVSAVDGDSDTVVVTHDDYGPTGNEFEVSTDCTNASWGVDVTTLSGGYLDDGKTIVIDSSAGATQTRTNKAINGTGTAGTDYSTTLQANELVVCGTFGSNDATITAQALGTEGNGIVSTSDFTSANNKFSATTLTGGADNGNFDDYIPSGETRDYATDEDIDTISLIAVGASTDIVVNEY